MFVDSASILLLQYVFFTDQPLDYFCRSAFERRYFILAEEFQSVAFPVGDPHFAAHIIRKVKEESGLDNLKVVATGGLGRVIADETDSIDIYDSSLTLDGLRIIYDKNRH